MKTYNLGSFGVAPTVAKPFPSASYGGSRGTRPLGNFGIPDPDFADVPAGNGVTGQKVVPSGFVGGGGDTYLNQVFETHNNPESKSQWEMDDDTRDFLTDAFNTLNQEDEYLGGGESGGGGGGLGGQFSGGPGTQHGTTWSFGKNAAFKPQGIF